MDHLANNPLATRLRKSQALLGLHHCYPADGILETIAHGWDFIWIDAQHGQFSWDSALRAVRCAAGLGKETVLRVPTHDPGWLGLYADTAASAIMAPQVDTPEAAASIVRALRFPPVGNRSFGGRRPVDVHGRGYYEQREPLVIVQIESRTGLDNVERIAALQGVDLLFFGADDMKLQLGIPLATPAAESDEIIRAQERTAHAARAAGIWCGCVCADVRHLRLAMDQGYQLLAAGADVRFLRSGSQRTLEDSRAVLDEYVLRATNQTVLPRVS